MQCQLCILLVYCCLPVCFHKQTGRMEGLLVTSYSGFLVHCVLFLSRLSPYSQCTGEKKITDCTPTHSHVINKHRLTCRCADKLFLFLCSKQHIKKITRSPCLCFAFLTPFLRGLTSFVLHNNGDEILWLPVATQYGRFNRP